MESVLASGISEVGTGRLKSGWVSYSYGAFNKRGKGERMSIDLGEIKVSKICEDKKMGTFWAIGTKNEYLEIRITRAGKIKPFSVTKKRHPYFTKENNS